MKSDNITKDRIDSLAELFDQVIKGSDVRECFQNELMIKSTERILRNEASHYCEAFKVA